MNVQQAKQRFGIIGDNPKLNRALEVVLQVAPTEISVLVLGESGTGKETIPQVIHHNSARKHGPYIAVNCGAIPEGTIDSELFGHEKGAFTGASGSRKGYFEEADGGTIFLDEVAELPVQTQVRLLRVLETGEFIRVGSSKVQKTNVRIVAATNINMQEAIQKGKFREDLYYRLSTVPVILPPLRERNDDVHLLFRKFSADFSDKYKMPGIRLTEDAAALLKSYRWPGNIRQLKNVAEQIAVIEHERQISKEILQKYLPDSQASMLPAVVPQQQTGSDFSERDLLYKVLFDMKKDIVEMKKVIVDLVQNNEGGLKSDNKAIIQKLYDEVQDDDTEPSSFSPDVIITPHVKENYPETPPSRIDEHEEVEEQLSLAQKEKELIIKALIKYNGKRKAASKELGISERTLYRKIKEYDISE